MNSEERVKLSKGWVALVKAPRPSDEYDSLFWAFDKMCELERDRPEECLIVVLSILREQKDDMHVLANLAAGPLENLLAYHGALLIDKIELLSRENPDFCNLLGGVWKNRISDDVWARVKASSGPPW